MPPIEPVRRIAALLALLTLGVLILLFGGTVPRAHAYENGKLPGSALSQANTGLRCDGNGDQLSNNAAAAFNTAALAAGHPLSVNGCLSLYRDFAGQVEMRNYWCGQGNCGNAAVPGYSNHGVARASDSSAATIGFFAASNGAYSFDKRCSDAPGEWWHIVACRPFDRPNPGTSLKYPTMRKGSGGPGQAAYVKRVQKRLRIHGLRNVTTDGDFGKVTAHAVKRFQKTHNLKPVDGIVGKATWRKLLKPPAKNGGGEGKPPKPPKPPNHDDHGPKHQLPTKTIKGVDVSEHQGDISWGKLRAAGIRFTWVKATEGWDFLDRWFTDNRMRAVEDAGIVPGVYHFLRPKPGRTGAAEASWFIDQILAAGYGKGWLPPAIDIEVTELDDKATCHYLRSAVTRVQRVLEVRPVIYTYPYFVTEHLVGCSWMGNYRLWIADYRDGPPSIPAPWDGRYLAHQYTGTGSVDGIVGNADINRMPGGVKMLEKIRVGTLPRDLVEPKKARPLAPGAIPAPVERGLGFATAAAAGASRAEVPYPEGRNR